MGKLADKAVNYYDLPRDCYTSQQRNKEVTASPLAGVGHGEKLDKLAAVEIDTLKRPVLKNADVSLLGWSLHILSLPHAIGHAGALTVEFFGGLPRHTH